ncbi:MAG TPA: acyl-[ACP]--phospholipid O-acyltransferase [Bryobacteraceae bacterium]|nr:acyl-[ACP]--phospholipid O-acyltransferase [Bryobacteraceae bacterium]
MAHGGFKDVLKNGGFHAFLWTQFFGAFNDNLYQMLVLQAAVEAGRSAGAVQIVYLLPFLLFSGYSGYLADVISKRTVLIGVKAFEILAMGVGALAIITGHMQMMLVVLFMMGLHSTVFSPAKYGIVPEILPDRDLSRGNAILEMTTLVGIVLGGAAGVFVFALWKGQAVRMALIPMAIALVGFLTSLRITRVAPSGATQKFRVNPYSEVVEGTRHLLHDRPLWLAVLGVAFFWSLGALLKPNLLLFGNEVLHAGELRSGLLLPFLSIGIGVGNMLAGRLSGDKVELGLVPLGSIIMGLSAIGIFAFRTSYALSVAALVLVGIASGLFIVPLYAYMQQRSDDQEKGRVVATNNFYQTIGMLGASALIWALHDQMGIGADTLMLGAGIAVLLVTVYILTVVPDYFIRFSLWLLTHTIFRIRIVGSESVPFRGPALLVSNHMSYIDGFMIGACVQRFIRFMVWKPIYDLKPLNWFFRNTNAIPVLPGSRRDVVESLQAARKALAEGHVVCIFAEGAITHTGNLLPFRRGLEKIVEKSDVPIIPVEIDRLWGSIFSFERGKFFWKWPKHLPYHVTVSFGKPVPSTTPAHEVRQAIQELASNAAALRKTAGDRLDLRVIHNARRNWKRFAMADSSGRELTYGRMLTGSVLISNWIRRHAAEGEMLGVLLPPSAAGAMVNVAATMAGCPPVNLNFTAGKEAIGSAMEQCRIRTVITSKIFLAKAKIEAVGNTVFIEEILARSGKAAQLRALLAARLLPAKWLSWSGRANPNAPEDSLATVIFSSGSTGVPKGVMLSHYNVIANIEAIAQVFWISDRDRIVGVLPFFHSFGFTVTIWFPLISGCGVVYHPNPTDAKAVGELVEKYKGTLLLSTPTFCSTYTRKCTPEQFASLRFVLVGAEKLRESVATAFHEKFGHDLLEGYGCTEMAPVVAVNAPNYEAGKSSQVGTKPGTVGHPLPGVAARIVDPVSFQPKAPNQEGLLLVKGSNRMLEYLNQPERTAEVFHDGWYITGDIALIDDEGFIRITDRLSRFSKIAGEMVPHIRIEEAMGKVLGDSPCAVTAVPDEERGERLVGLYTQNGLSPSELWQRLSETDLPRLWIPKRENLYAVESLPLLGTGKVDLRGLKALAQQRLVATARL